MNKKQELQHFLDVAMGRVKLPPGPAAQARAERRPPGPRTQGKLSAAAREKQAIDQMIREQEQELASLRKRQTTLARQLTGGIEAFGVVSDKTPDQVVVSSSQFKAQKKWNGEGRLIDAVRVREIFPELCTSDAIVNLTILSEVVMNAGIPHSHKLLARFKKLIKKIENKIGAQIVEKQDDGGIDLGRYASYKRLGKITPAQAEIFEHIEGPLKVSRLPRRGRK